MFTTNHSIDSPPSAGYRDRAIDNDQISPIEEEILSCLLGRELYGLQIVDAFKGVSNGRRRMSIGTLYPVLARLEQKSLVTSRMDSGSSVSKGGARRKFFKITQRGSCALSEAERFRRQLTEWQPAMA